MFRSLVYVLLCVGAAASAGQVRNGLRHDRAAGFVAALDFHHKLRVCNAYPNTDSLAVFRGKEELTGLAPMPYKACRDFEAPMKSGDKLEFKIGDAMAGTFSVADLPQNDAIMLLVIHRHDTLSTAVSFESHVFANLMNAQIAVIDTYRGAAKSNPEIRDLKQEKGTAHETRSEQLRYDSVVAVNAGTYEVVLKGQNGTVAKSSLVALDKESYVVLRTGVEAQQGESFPQEIVVFPRSDGAALRSGAAALTRLPMALFACVAALIVAMNLW